MAEKKKKKLGTATLRSDIVLADGEKAPTRLRLLRAGDNTSDQGTFTFDALAAAMVMANFAMDGKPRLISDWNHGSLPKYATREQGASCCSFVPAVVDGELIADDIRWTEDGAADVESRAYNYFSPAFQFEYGDDGVSRPCRLFNFALVNLAGLKDIDTLMAASAAIDLATSQREDEIMEFEKLYNEGKVRIAELETENRTLRGASSDVVALGAAIGVRADAPSAERLTAVSGLVALRASVLKATGQETPETAIGVIGGLVALRGEVFALTGKTTPEDSIGALRAMKTNSDEAVTLKAQIEQEKTIALRAELDGVWAGAISEFKLEPAKKDAAEASLLALSGGKVTRAVVDGAKTMVAMLSAKVVGGSGTEQRETGSGLLTPEDRLMQEASGGRYTLEQITEYKRRKLVGRA